MKKSNIGYELKGTVRELTDLKGPEYAYLGHFGKKHFLEEGHNFSKSQKGSNILGALSSGLFNMAGVIAKGQAARPDKPDMPKKQPGTTNPDMFKSDPAEPFTVASPPEPGLKIDPKKRPMVPSMVTKKYF